MRLQQKLVVLVGSIILLMGLASGWSLVQLVQVKGIYQSTIQAELAAAIEAQRLRATFLNQHQELKNVWLRGADPQQFTRYTGQFDAAATKIQAIRATLKSLEGSLTSDELALLKTFDTGHAEYMAAWPKARDGFKAAGADSKVGDAAMQGKDRAAVAALDQLTDKLDARADQTTVAVDRQTTTVIFGVIGVMLLAIALGLTLSIVLARGIVGAISPLTSLADTIAQVDLPALVNTLHAWAAGNTNERITISAQPVPVERQDEFGDLAVSFNQMIEGMHSVSSAFASLTSNLEVLRKAVGTWRDRKTS